MDVDEDNNNNENENALILFDLQKINKELRIASDDNNINNNIDNIVNNINYRLENIIINDNSIKLLLSNRKSILPFGINDISSSQKDIIDQINYSYYQV